MAKRKSKQSQVNAQSVPERRIHKGWLLGILIVHIVLCFIYWHYTDFGAPPDETGHNSYIHYMVSERSLPVYFSSNNDTYECYQPPLYYALGLPFFMAGKLIGLSEPSVAVRLLSIILGALSVLLVYLTMKRIFPRDDGVAIGCAGFVALLPTHVMISSMVSNDIIMEVVFGLAILLMVGMQVGKLTWRQSTFLGIALGLGILSKMTCLILFPIAVASYLLILRRTTETWTVVLKHAGLALGIAFLVGGWWFVRNQLVYGDALGIAEMKDSFFLHSKNVQESLNAGMPLNFYLGMIVTWTFRSFWCVLGPMTIQLDPMVYIVLAVLSVVTAITCRRGILRRREVGEWSSSTGIILGLVLGLVAISFIQMNMMVFQSQGRYLYPALIPFALIWYLGIEGILGRGNRLTTWLAIGVPMGIQVLALIYCVTPGIIFH